MATESRIVQRALILFIVLATISASVLSMLFRRSLPPERPEPRAEPLITLVCVPVTGFPGTLTWSAVACLGEVLPSAPGWEIRYTATEVLARRGSPKVPLGTLREMLDEERQMRNFRSTLKDGRVVANQTRALNEILVALKALNLWHKHADAVEAAAGNPDLEKVYQAVEKLAHSSNDVVRTRAQDTLLALNRKQT